MFAKLKRIQLKRYHWAAIPSFLVVIVFVLSQILVFTPQNEVLAADLENRSVQVMNPLPSAISEYFFRFDVSTPSNLGSILFQFCSNGPVLQNCQTPAGFSTAGVTITSESGPTNFVLGADPNRNEILLTRNPSFADTQAATYVFDGIQNAQDTGTSYVEITTFTGPNGTGSEIDRGGLAYSITNALDLSTEVPQFLEFCAGISIFGFDCTSTNGNSIDFGNLTPKSTSDATSQFMGATNAAFGYNVYLNGSSLTSGNNVITAAAGSGSTTGTNQFGLNLRANTDPQVGADPQGPGSITVPSTNYDQPNRFRFSDGDIIASTPTSDDYQKFTVSYIININSSEPAGDYVSTMNYICLANF